MTIKYILLKLITISLQT